MIRIAFCDDDPSVIDTLSALLEQYRAEHVQELMYDAYQDSASLLSDMEQGALWDILLLDVLMPEKNGMDLAEEIRRFLPQAKLLFLTSSPEFAVRSYEVGAYFYQLKPISKDRFFPVLERSIEDCVNVHREKLVLKCKTGIAAIHLDKLEYCEVIGRSLLLHLKNGKVLESVGKMDELEQRLAEFGSFLRVHRSYLVNMDYIQNISYRAVTLACMRDIPIPHGKCNEIKRTYQCYLKTKKEFGRHENRTI